MAEISETQTYHLRILVQPPKAGSLGWEVSVYLGGACFAKNITLSDPFTKAEEDECRWYLEDYLTKTPFEKARAEIAAESLNSYADSLFDQLRLSRVWRRLSGPSSPKNKVLEIDIVESAEDSTAVSSDTVHRLHWEVLEYPRLWKNVNVRTTVRRIISQEETPAFSIRRVESWSQGVPAVTILLVISRRLLRGGGEEVDPNLVFHSMQTLKKDLETRGAAFRLNIEIVRPGSFKALKKHLDERSKRHRNGDIHIVHFDVHGRVGLRSEKGEAKATTAAFLYFQSGKGDGTLAPTRAGAVADLLSKHNIRIVVLNACESAKANKGDEANIARTFTKAGVQNVLAMAYKTLGGTCTAFMRCFYESLIANGNPFSIAVRDAREYLRLSPNRDARFALNRPLEDWIVPVVYASGKDAELRISTLPDNGLEDTFQWVSRELGTPSNHPTIFGRGFDVLRFETMFLAGKITSLCGPAGVGKTAFIQQLVSSWQQTGLYDNILYVDCSLVQMDGIDTPVFLQHLLCNDKQKSSLPALTGPKAAQYRWTIPVLGDNIQVVVLDNLEATHSDVDEMNGHGRWPESRRVALMALINDILRDSPEEVEEGVSFILLGRSDDDNWWKKHFPDLPPFPRYRLNGLSLPDAIEYAHNLLGEYGLDRSQWGHADEDVLSQILNILQCNPLAIQTILETAASRNYPWKELFEDILFRQYLCLEPVVSDERSFITRDMTSASIDGPQKAVYANVFSALALYWHQGPSQDSLKMLVGLSQGTLLATALEFGVDRGYFSVDSRGYVENIHPLFTVMGRITFASVPVVLWKPLQWVLNADQDSEEDLSAPWFVGSFFQGVDSRDLAGIAKNTGLAGKFRGFEKDLRPAFYNILVCLRLCSVGKTPISIDWWPYALQLYGYSAMWFLSVDETALMVKHYEIFLRRFIIRRPKTVEVRILGTMISIGNFLTTAHLTISSLPTKRAKDFSLLTFNLINNTDDELRKDGEINGIISVAMMNRDLADFSQGSKTLAETEVLRNALPASIKGDTKEALASFSWTDLEHSIPDPQQRAHVIENFVQKGNIQAKISEIRKNANGVDPAELASAFSRMNMDAAVKGPPSGWYGLAQNLDTTTRSAELERSLDVRNRTEAIKHYKALLAQALKDWNVEEVMELHRSLAEIYGTDEAFAEDLKVVLEEKKKFESLHHMLKLSTSIAGIGEIPKTSRVQLEDIKRLDIMTSENGFFHSTMERLYESALSKGFGSTIETRVQRPKKHFKDLMDDWRQQVASPEGRETLRELGKQFGYLFDQHMKAMEAGDFEKAIELFDKVIEIDQPEILAGIPFLSVPEYRQSLVSIRDFMNTLATIGQVVDEDREADAINMVESLLHDHEIGNFPGLPEPLVQTARNNLRSLLWNRCYNAWKDAFNSDEYSQALLDIIPFRNLESSGSFDEPVDTNLGSFYSREFTDWNHLQTLHRHFHQSKRPHLALKTVSYLLKRYDMPENLKTLPWMLPQDLERERAFKWFYEFVIQRKICLQSLTEKDIVTVLQQLQAIGEISQNAPERLGEFVPEKLLSELAVDQKTIYEGFLQIMTSFQSTQS
jgi:hypothetical protein